jgi:hypothetical protein
MWGLGAAVYIVNALPFVYLLASPLLFRRYNFLGINQYGSSRNYYKRFWFRAIFGRFQYYFVGIAGSCYILQKIGNSNTDKKMLLDFSAFLSEIEEFPEEQSEQHQLSFTKYQHEKRLNENKDLVLQRRAEMHRNLKLEAFQKYASENNL